MKKIAAYIYISEKGIEILSDYLDILGYKLVKNVILEDENKKNVESGEESKMEMLAEMPTVGGTVAPERGGIYKIDGDLDNKSFLIVVENFGLIEEMYNSFQSNDLRSLQMQGEKVFPEILRSLRIDLSLINKINSVATHDSGVFTSKCVTFALQQLEFENRDARLS